MESTRKFRKDSITGAIKDAQAEMNPPEPAHTLTAKQRKIFDTIIFSRELISWNPIDLMIATKCAQTMAKYDDELKLIAKEESVILNRFGALVANPRVAIINSLNYQILSMIKQLGLGPGYTDKDKNRAKVEVMKRNEHGQYIGKAEPRSISEMLM